tara:strand:+ start:2671 stop:2772 length:102 start_codon:yes stop_codon:yes gene_type:complete
MRDSRLTLGTRAGLKPQRGGKAVTVLPLVKPSG